MKKITEQDLRDLTNRLNEKLDEVWYDPRTWFGGDKTKPQPNAQVAPASSVPANVAALAKANGIADPNKIQAGQQIKLPDGTPYTIKSGDTLTKIANMKPAAPATTRPGAELSAAAGGDAAKNPAPDGSNAATAIPSGTATVATSPAATTTPAPQGSIATDTTDPLAPNNQPPQPPVARPVVDANGKPAAAAPAAFDPTGKTPAQIQDARNKGLIDESVSFRNNELSRILTLVHHR